MTSHWDDDGVTEADIAVREQNEIAVYRNAYGGVSLRQRNWPDDDTLITVTPENARQLCDAILRCAEQIAGEDAELAADDDSDDSPAPPHPRKDRTAAERKRRQRDNQRERDRSRNVTRETVTRDTSVTVLPSPANDDENEETRERRHR